MSDDIAISVDHLSKVYKIFDKPADRVKEAFHPFHKRYSRDFYALKDISFEVRRGENIGFIGRNGAGKSTLLKLITGVLTPTTGTISVNGNVASLLELGAGFNMEMTGIENIYMNGSIMGHSKEEMDGLLDGIAAFADIGEFIHQPVKMYSSGMFARLAFAVNAFVEPDILIVDEALSVGDSSFQIKCMKKMRELMESGTAVLFVSHDIGAIRRFCNRAFWLDHGELKQQGETNLVADAYSEFLKLQDAANSNQEKVQQAETGAAPVATIAEIMGVRILDPSGKEVEAVPYDMPVQVEVTYEVRKKVDKPVLGLALMSVDDSYVCGVNTLLDKADIPWEIGVNRMVLDYNLGIRAVGGRYTFDVALFEETATVPIQYLNSYKMFSVLPHYMGEGTVILPHQWKRGEKDGKV